MTPPIVARIAASLVLAALLGAAPAAAQGSPLIQDTGSVFYVPFNDMPLGDAASGPTLTLNGDLYFSAPSIDICVGTDPNQPSHCPGGVSVQTELKAGFALELDADQSGAYERRLSLGSVPIYYFTFPGSPNLTGTVLIEGALVIEGEVEAGMRVGMVGQFELDASIEFFRSVTKDLDPPKNVAFEFSPPQLTGATALELEVAFEGGVYVQFEFGGVPFSKPYVKAKAGVELSVEPAADPWWDADGFIEPSAGWDFLLLPPLEGRGRRLTWDLVDAGGPLGGLGVPARWCRAYDYEAAEYVTDLKPFQSGFVAVGLSHTAGNTGWIAALDADGSVLWEKRSQTGVDTLMRPKEVHVTSDGGVVVGGSQSSSSGARIDRYDSLGNPLWTRSYLNGVSGTLTLDSLITTSDGGLAFAGSYSPVAEDTSMVVVKLDSLGNQEWAVIYELDNLMEADDGHALQLIETTTGRFLAVGDAAYQDAPPPDNVLNNRCAALLMLEADGQLAWATALGGIGSDGGVGVTQVLGGDFILIGHVFGEDETAWTARVDPAGTLLWSRTLGGESDGGNDRARGIVSCPGGALIAGTSSHGPHEDGWLAKIDQDGDTVWFKSVLGPNEDELTGIVRLSTGLATWGRTRSLQPLGVGGDEDEMWIARAPHDGMLHFDPAYGIDVHNALRASSATVKVVSLPLPGQVQDAVITEAPSVLVHDVITSIVTVLTQ